MPGVLRIPITGLDGFVEVPKDELPEDAGDVIEILRAELPPLDLWLQFAVEYYKQGKHEQAHEILQEGAAINDALNEKRADPSTSDLEAHYGESKAERIAILNALAAYYTQLAAQEKDKRKRDEYFQKATANYNLADRIDSREAATWVGKGVLLLTKGEFDRAGTNFQNALDISPDNVPAFLGKACMCFNKGQYEEALKLYKQALQTNPDIPAAVRLGLGYCYYKLNNLPKARLCFQRVLQLEDDNVEALVALAVLDMNSEEPDGIGKALEKLEKASKKNLHSAAVLNHLSNHYFFKTQYREAHALAKYAFSSTEVPTMKAEACYYMGRCHHAKGEYEQALQYYYQAHKAWPEYVLPFYGLGQMYLFKGDTDRAIANFEKVLLAYPDNFETLKVLGSLYSRTGKKDIAMTTLKRVVEVYPDDYESHIHIGELLEHTDQEGALKAYRRALNLLRDREEPVPAALLNNIGVLLHVKGDLTNADKSYHEALDAEEGETKNVTTTYNMARLCEDRFEVNKAEQLYKEIATDHPAYLDCYLRLGCIQHSRGVFNEASNLFLRALKIHEDLDEFDESAFDALTLLGNLHMEKENSKDWQNAAQKFKQILAKNKNDAYSTLSIGNVYYYISRIEGKDKKDREDNLSKALDCFRRVLQKEPSNVYAANGIGVVLADMGRINEARDIFSQVREATADIPDVWINLGHIYTMQGVYDKAIKMYENCLKKFYFNKEPSVLLFLAKAFFDSEKYLDAKRVLLKAMHVMPDNPAFRYNLALSQFKYGTKTTQYAGPSIVDLRSAVNELQQSRQIFKELVMNRPKNKELNYDIGRATKLKTEVRLVYHKAKTLLSNAEDREAALEVQQEKIRNEVHEKVAKMIEDEERRKAAAEEEKRRDELIAAEKMNRLEEMKNAWKAQRDAEDYAEKRKEREREGGVVPRKKKAADSEPEEAEDVPEERPAMGMKEFEQKLKKRRGKAQESDSESEAEAEEGGWLSESKKEEDVESDGEAEADVEMEKEVDVGGRQPIEAETADSGSSRRRLRQHAVPSEDDEAMSEEEHEPRQGEGGQADAEAPSEQEAEKPAAGAPRGSHTGNASANETPSAGSIEDEDADEEVEEGEDEGSGGKDRGPVEESQDTEEEEGYDPENAGYGAQTQDGRTPDAVTKSHSDDDEEQEQEPERVSAGTKRRLDDHEDVDNDDDENGEDTTPMPKRSRTVEEDQVAEEEEVDVED